MAKRYLERNIVAVVQELTADGVTRVSALDVATRLAESRGTVGRYLNALVSSGRLNRVGSGRATRYELADVAQWLERHARSRVAHPLDAHKALAAYQAYEAARTYAERLQGLVAERSRRRSGRKVGLIVVTPDGAAHGKYVAAILGELARRIEEFRGDGLESTVTTVGELAKVYGRTAQLPIASSIDRLYTASRLEGLIGILKTQCDDYLAGRTRAIYIVHASFIEPERQGVAFERVLPVDAAAGMSPRADEALRADIVRRYLEGMVLRSVSETLALEAALADGN